MDSGVGGPTSGEENNLTTMDAADHGLLRATRILDLSAKGLRQVPQLGEEGVDGSVCQLSMHHNHLTSMPESFLSAFQNTLQHIDLSNNQLSSWPGIELANLKTLNLACNRLVQFPRLDPTTTPKLNEVNVSFNRISGSFPPLTLPDKLKVLLCSNNFLTAINIPPLLEIRDTLQCLDLSNNDISSVPVKLCFLERLTALQLSGNTFKVPRLAILDKGTPSILQYLRERVLK